MADSSESDLCEVTNSPNFTGMVKRAKKITDDLPKVADTIENIIRGNYRKSIISRAVHPSLVCSTPFAPNKLKDNISFSSISTLLSESEEQNNQSYRKPQNLKPQQKEISINGDKNISAYREPLIVENTSGQQISKPSLNSSFEKEQLAIDEFSKHQTSKLNISTIQKNNIPNIVNDCRIGEESGLNKSNKIINEENKYSSTGSVQSAIEIDNQLSTSKLKKRKAEHSGHKQNDIQYDSHSISKRKKAIERTIEESSSNSALSSVDIPDKSNFSHYVPKKKEGIIKEKTYFPLKGKMGKTRARSLSKTKKSHIKYVYVSDKENDNNSDVEYKQKNVVASKTIEGLKYSDSSEESDYSVELDRPIKLKTKKIRPQGKLIYIEDDPVMASEQKIIKQRINKGRSISRRKKEYFHDWGSSNRKTIKEVLKTNNVELNRFPQIKRRTRLVEVSMSDSDIPEKEERIIYYKVPKSSSRRHLKDIISLPEIEHKHRVVPSRYYEPSCSYVEKNDSERPKSRRNYSRPRRTRASSNQGNYSPEEYTSSSECEAAKNFHNEKKSAFKKYSRLSRRDSYILEKKIQNKNPQSVERNIEQNSFPSTVLHGRHEKFLDTPHQVIDPHQQNLKLIITEIVNDQLNKFKNVYSKPSNESEGKSVNKILDSADETSISNNKNINKNNNLSKNCNNASLESQENVDKSFTGAENSNISINKTLDNAYETYIPNNENITKNNVSSKNCARELLENVDKIVVATENSDISCPFEKFDKINITEKKKILKRLARTQCSESDWVYNYIFPMLAQRKTQKRRKTPNKILNRNSLTNIIELLSQKPSEIVNVDIFTSSKEFQMEPSLNEKHEIQPRNIDVTTNSNSLLLNSVEHYMNSKNHKTKNTIGVCSLPSKKIIIHSVKSIVDEENSNRNDMNKPLTRKINETITELETESNVASNLNESCLNNFLEPTGTPEEKTEKTILNEEDRTEIPKIGLNTKVSPNESKHFECIPQEEKKLSDKMVDISDRGTTFPSNQISNCVVFLTRLPEQSTDESTRVPKKKVRASSNTKSQTENERQKLGVNLSDSRRICDQIEASSGISSTIGTRKSTRRRNAVCNDNYLKNIFGTPEKGRERKTTTKQSVKKGSKTNKEGPKSKESEYSTVDEDSATKVAKSSKGKKNGITKKQNKNSTVEPLSDQADGDYISSNGSSTHSRAASPFEKEDNYSVDEELDEKYVEKEIITKKAAKRQAKSSGNKMTSSDSESTSTVKDSNINVTKPKNRNTSPKPKKRKKRKTLGCKIPKMKTVKKKDVKSPSKKTIEGSMGNISIEARKSSGSKSAKNIHYMEENNSSIVQDQSNDPEHWARGDMHIRNLGKTHTGVYSLEEKYGYIALPPKSKKKFINTEYDVFYTRLEGANSLLSREINLQEAPLFFVIPKGTPACIKNTGDGRVLLFYLIKK